MGQVAHCTAAATCVRSEQDSRSDLAVLRVGGSGAPLDPARHLAKDNLTFLRVTYELRDPTRDHLPESGFPPGWDPEAETTGDPRRHQEAQPARLR